MIPQDAQTALGCIARMEHVLRVAAAQNLTMQTVFAMVKPTASAALASNYTD